MLCVGGHGWKIGHAHACTSHEETRQTPRESEPVLPCTEHHRKRLFACSDNDRRIVRLQYSDWARMAQIDRRHLKNIPFNGNAIISELTVSNLCMPNGSTVSPYLRSIQIEIQGKRNENMECCCPVVMPLVTPSASIPYVIEHPATVIAHGKHFSWVEHDAHKVCREFQLLAATINNDDNDDDDHGVMEMIEIK